MVFITPVLGLLSFFMVFYAYYYLLSANRYPPNLPRGPPQLPVVGNLHQLSLQKLYLRIAELCQKYSSNGLMGLRLGPSNYAVVISNGKTAHELLGKAIYSSRPPMLALEMVLPPPGDYHMVALPYGDKWRKEIKTAKDFLSESAMAKRAPINEAESTQLMHDLLVSPERFREHTTRFHGAVILTSSLIKRFFDVQDDWAIVTSPGFLPPYDIFPFLRYVPDILTPWRNWREKVQHVKQNQQALYHDLVAVVRERMAQGRSRDCFMQRLLEKQEKDGYTDTDLAYFGGVLMEGGSDTTRNAFETFLLAMVANPAVCEKAQAEVDGVYGDDRMPVAVHNENLPYLHACILETLRWRPIFPSGVPHATSKDDVYEGHFIPADSMVILDIWGIHHDPNEFKDPEVFDPKRFLLEPKTKFWTFGAGRRACPGQEMALRSLLLTAAKLLWCFDIRAESLHEMGTSIEAFQGDMLMGPKPFKASFQVRSERRRRIIEGEWAKADAYLKDFE
ncbi:cytochrome P450 [Astrocystis sublimbata]|nr:cytochrome P450 [Astrocystis sublimbata]